MLKFFLENDFSAFMPKPIDTIKLNSVLETWTPEKQFKLAAQNGAAIFERNCEVAFLPAIDYPNSPTVPVFHSSLASMTRCSTSNQS